LPLGGNELNDAEMKTVPRPRKTEVAATVRTIIHNLRAMRNSERAKGVQQYFKHEIVALGIDTPALRAYCREQEKRLKPVWNIGEAIALCDRLLQEEEMEIRGAGLLILGAFKKEFTPDLLPWAKRWLDTRLDNWALVDGFCGSVLSPLLEAHPSVEATLHAGSHARLLWVRRATLVTLVPFARRGKLLDLSYGLASEHFADPEDLMHKATGWLLREAGKTDMPRLRRFLLEHGSAIPRTALRYAIERFPVSERGRLLRLTRSASPLA
jgi:3-methyladenine DNA glycosylase AlkD